MTSRFRLLVSGTVAALIVAGCSTAEPAATSPPSIPGTVSTSSTPPPTTSPTTTSSTVAPPTTTEPAADPVGGLAAVLDGLAAREEFSGVALIGNGSDVVFEFAGGLADRDANVPIDMDTKFNLGSMNKMFTAVAIMQLVERGSLELDGTVADYLPDYPNPDVAAEITIDQLLTHTSGLGDAFTPEFEADPNAFRDDEDYLPFFADDPLQFAPGEAFFYSNAGYVVLGLIIERSLARATSTTSVTTSSNPAG